MAGTAQLDATSKSRRRYVVELVVGGAGYLVVSVAIMWHVLTSSVGSAATCTCSDVSQFTWFLSWPSVALRHASNPFFSTSMFHAGGINLLANTSVTGLGIPLIPFEWLFGPGATMNVALVATPVANGVAMMWLARRFVSRSWIAFIAGLLYAFSPLVMFHQALGHLNVTFLVVPVLVVGLVDELVFRRGPHPRRTGLAIGLLMTWQFFLGSEIFIMMLVAGACSLAALALWALVSDREGLISSWRYCQQAVGVAAATTVVLLAAPVAYAAFGPRHYSGPVWPGVNLSVASLQSYFSYARSLTLWFAPAHGGFLGPTYLSPLLLLVLAGGLVAFRRDRQLWCALSLGALMAWLALGSRYVFSPWHYARHVSVLVNIVNERFAAFMFLFVALALAIVAERIVTSSWLVSSWRVGAAALALTASLSVYVAAGAQAAPYPASSLWVPTWYQQVAPSLPANQVILGFPFFNTSANLLGVQAHYRMRYAVVGGTTPQWLPIRQGAEAPGYRVIWDLASTAADNHMPTTATPYQRTAVLSALAGWRTTLVVVPFTNGPNTSPVARDPMFVRTFLASILGAPLATNGAWVWKLP